MPTLPPYFAVPVNLTHKLQRKEKVHNYQNNLGVTEERNRTYVPTDNLAPRLGYQWREPLSFSSLLPCFSCCPSIKAIVQDSCKLLFVSIMENLKI